MPDAAIDVDTGGRRLPLAATSIRDLAGFVLGRERVKHAMLSVTFLTRRGIATMNRRHLGHRGPTDVITFALGRTAAAAPLVGDVYIAPEVVREHARSLDVPVREELARVVVHGVLHAIGHDHPDGDDRTASPMWRRQEQLLAAARTRGLW